MGRRSILALLRSVRGSLAVVVLSTTAALLLPLMVDPVAASPGLGGAQETERYVFAYDAPNDIAMARPSRVGIIGAGAAPGLLRSPFPAAQTYDQRVDFVAPNSTRIFRAVEPDELADLRSFGQYRAGGPHAEWLDGKRFWLSQTDADAYVALATKADLGGPYCVTSGCIPNSVLDQIQVVTMDGMDAVFLPNELLPFINDLSLPSPP